jgi:hypothetical protein
VLDESAPCDEVHIHQECRAYIRRWCREGGRTYLGRSAMADPESGLRKSGDDLIAAQKSAEGVVGRGARRPERLEGK